MIYWHWNNILGELVYEQTDYRTNKKITFRKRILRGDNCLAVIANRTTVGDMGETLAKPTWTVYGEFWNDQKHLEICLGVRKGEYTKKYQENIYADVRKVRINTYWKGECGEIARAFAKAHIDIEFYYEEPKKPKTKKEKKQ